MQENAASVDTSPDHSDGFQPTRYQIKFTGSGTEFFGIWWVNLFLTVITFGIYSAWAKVRVKRYFYGHTELAGSAFDFLANPVKVLIGRLIAVALFAIYYICSNLSIVLGIVIAGAIFLFLPLIILNSFSFRLKNSAYRNIRFNFRKDYKTAYKVWSIPIIIIIIFISITSYMGHYGKELQEIQAQAEKIEVPINSDSNTESDLFEPQTKIEYQYTEEEKKRIEELQASLKSTTQLFGMFYLLMFILFLCLFPLFERALFNLIYNNISYGKTKFQFIGTAGGLYNIYIRHFIICLGIFFIIVLAGVFVSLLAALFSSGTSGGSTQDLLKSFGVIFILGIILLYIGLIILSTYLTARLKALKYNWKCEHVKLLDHSIDAELTPMGLTKVYLLNTVIALFTFGIGIPFAIVNIYRYTIENTYFTAASNLDEFVAADQAQQSALGDEVGDVFDLEIGL